MDGSWLDLVPVRYYPAIIIGFVSLFVSGIGVFMKLAWDKITTAADQIETMSSGQTETTKQAMKTLEAIHDIQGVQAENHLKTIQETNIVIKEEAIKTNAKLDTLITIFEKKL